MFLSTRAARQAGNTRFPYGFRVSVHGEALAGGTFVLDFDCDCASPLMREIRSTVQLDRSAAPCTELHHWGTRGGPGKVHTRVRGVPPE